MGYDHPEELLNLDEDAARKLVAINISSMNAMCRLVMPQMAKRRRGAVINLSSMSCLIRMPLYSVYAGTKAYVDVFTAGLELEYRSKGITTQCVLPGYVVSNMSKLRKPSLIAPTPEVFVKSALGRLGIEKRTCGKDTCFIYLFICIWKTFYFP